MGLLKRYKDFKENRRVRRIVQDHAARWAQTKPSDIAQFAADVPRAAKRAHKLEVRRGYRSPIFKGVVSSNQRQILAESVATRFYEDAENERKRQADEDRLYGVAS